MSKLKNNKTLKEINHHKLYFIIGILLIINAIFLGFLSSNYPKNTKETVPYKQTKNYTDFTETTPLPKKIATPEFLNKVVNDINLEPVIQKSDKNYKIELWINNLSALEDKVILQDFVNTIKFDTHLDITEAIIKSDYGTVFPPDKQVNISYYGPGTPKNKKTQIQISILDINIKKLTAPNRLKLYELDFSSTEKPNKITIDNIEFRQEKNIVNFPAIDLKIIN